MMKRHNFYLILVPFLITFLWTSSPLKSVADERHYQNLIITKYGLSETDETFFGIEKDKENFLKINNIPLDSNGFRLNPLKNVTYTIQEIVPKEAQTAISISDPASYILTGVTYEITTNEQGIAEISLKDGDYLLTEQANPTIHLNEPAAPSLLSLPVVNMEGTSYLENVYIYPKSKTDHQKNTTPVDQKPPKADEPATGEKEGAFPDLGTNASMANIISGLGVLLLLIWFGLRRESD